MKRKQIDGACRIAVRIGIKTRYLYYIHKVRPLPIFRLRPRGEWHIYESDLKRWMKGFKEK